MMTSTKRYTEIAVPALVIFAIPHVPETWMTLSPDPALRKAAEAYFTTLDAITKKQAKAFEEGVPMRRVVRLQGMHYIFLSNEPDVLREMRAFLADLR